MWQCNGTIDLSLMPRALREESFFRDQIPLSRSAKRPFSSLLLSLVCFSLSLMQNVTISAEAVEPHRSIPQNASLSLSWQQHPLCSPCSKACRSPSRSGERQRARSSTPFYANVCPNWWCHRLVPPPQPRQQQCLATKSLATKSLAMKSLATKSQQQRQQESHVLTCVASCKK